MGERTGVGVLETGIVLLVLVALLVGAFFLLSGGQDPGDAGSPSGIESPSSGVPGQTDDLNVTDEPNRNDTQVELPSNLT